MSLTDASKMTVNVRLQRIQYGNVWMWNS